VYKKILVLVDDRKVTQSAIHQAIELAKAHRADILFFHVLPAFVHVSVEMLPISDMSADEFRAKASEEAARMLSDATALAESAGVHSHRAVGEGKDDAHCVAEAAVKRHCDLIVVGTEEQNAVVRLLTGSIVPGLISVATVPVLICRDQPHRKKHSRADHLNARRALLCEELGTRGSKEDND